MVLVMWQSCSGTLVELGDASDSDCHPQHPHCISTNDEQFVVFGWLSTFVTRTFGDDSGNKRCNAMAAHAVFKFSSQSLLKLPLPSVNID